MEAVQNTRAERRAAAAQVDATQLDATQLDAGVRAASRVELQAGLTADEVGKRLEVCLRHTEVGQRGLAFYLADMDARRLHQEVGYSSAVFFAEARLDLSPRRARELIAIGRRLEDLPAIDEAFCLGELSWSKVVRLVRVVTPEHEVRWLDRARLLTCKALELEVKLARPGAAPRAGGDRRGLPEIVFDVRARVPALAHRKLELAKEKLSAERGEAIDDAAFLEAAAELILQTRADGTVEGREPVDDSLYKVVLTDQGGASEGLCVESELGLVPIDAPVASAVGERGAANCRAGERTQFILCDAEHVRLEALPAEAHTRIGPTPPRPRGGVDFRDIPTPPRLRKRVIARDGGACRNCRSRRGLMVHHIRYRSHGGRTEATNLITLCTACHALVHADLLEILGGPATAAVFRGRGGPLRRRRGAAASLRVHRSSPAAGATTAGVPSRGSLLTLASIPSRVDAAWWRTHAHCFRPNGTHGMTLRTRLA